MDQLTQRLRRSRSACVREAIAQVVQWFGQNHEAMRQSALIAQQVQETQWSEPLPDWSDWTASLQWHCNGLDRHHGHRRGLLRQPRLVVVIQANRWLDLP